MRTDTNTLEAGTASAGIFEGLSHDAYHALNAAYIGHSMKELLRKNPAKFFGTFIDCTIPKKKPGKPQLIGTHCHCATLEPDKFEDGYVVAPENAPDGKPWNRALKDHKVAWAEWLIATAKADPSLLGEVAAMKVAEWPEWLASVSSVIVIDQETFDTVRSMRDAILEHPQANEIIESATEKEVARWWRDPVTGILCKSKPDAVSPGWSIEHKQVDILGDIKSSADPSPAGFSKSCLRFGYLRQDPWYADGYEIATGNKARMRFITVQSSAPWTVAVYELEESDRQLGREQNATALHELRWRQEKSDWKAAWTKGVVRLAMPAYVRNENDYLLPDEE